ncbi:CDP-diacylglycerol--serine O-phosphatidyltransferase [Roseovarius sp. S4756]|uniref:CDP-diacylglycerol--serine O-phosphatidyltransferase n=1 Tax=Roseovarius maritimus TaxID=3342637 RepID=UPI00372B060F
MKDAGDKSISEIPLIHLLPNMLTIASICAGLSAIRFGVHGDYALAVKLVIAACVLDGLDGRIARLMRSDSKMGAELDSLADFLNFGVAPPLIIYYWALQDMRSAAWIAVMVFAICCAMRLARFNVATKAEAETGNATSSAYFSGVPSPAAALLALLPMSISFAFADSPILPDIIICAHLLLVGWLMISRIPTWSFKKTRVSRKYAKFYLVGFAIIGAALLTYAWITLVVLCLAYVGSVLWCVAKTRPTDRPTLNEEP